jgi:exonuclease III
MKILTWNCNQGIGNDFSIIKDFDADVVIIQECEKLDKKSLECQLILLIFILKLALTKASIEYL